MDTLPRDVIRKFSNDLSVGHEIRGMTRGGRVTVDQRQVGLLDRLGRATSGIGCSRAHPRGVPKSLAFEFYLMRLELEHIMN